jgi:hypothetical protein
VAGSLRSVTHTLSSAIRHVGAIALGGGRMVSGTKVVVLAHQLGIDVSTLARTAAILMGEPLHECVKRGARTMLQSMINAHQSSSIKLKRFI